MDRFIAACMHILAFLAICFFIGFFLGCGSTPDESASPAPTYDAECVIRSSTMGCIDQATYDEVLREQEAREDAAAPDEGDPPGLHGP
jgi:hypothetical protein